MLFSERSFAGAFCQHSRRYNWRSSQSCSQYALFKPTSLVLAHIRFDFICLTVWNVNIVDVRNHPLLIHCKRGKVELFPIYLLET